MLTCAAIGANADQEALPTTYTRGSADGRFIFVMLATNTPIDEDWGVFMTPEMTADLRRKYPASGMYLNDGSTNPLWTVDWYSFGVDVSMDGDHIVRHGPWPGRGEYEAEAVSFFRRDKLLRTYKISELVSFPALLPHSVSHFTWQKDAYFDRANPGAYVLTTLHGETYWIDLSTGEIFDSLRLPRIVLTSSATALFGVLVFVVLKKRVRARKRRDD